MKMQRALPALAGCAALVLLSACSSKADRIESALRKGADYVKAAKWDKANVEVRNVLQIDPKNAEAFYLGGQVAEAKGDIQNAFARYFKAVDVKPEHFDAKVALARIYLMAGMADKSQGLVDDVIKAYPEHIGGRTIKVALAARNGDVAGAVAQAKALLAEQKSAPVDASMLLAGIYANQGNDPGALAIIERALEGEPKNVGLLQAAAQIASGSPTPAIRDKALPYFRRAAELAPKSIELWSAWVLYHDQRNELDLAEEVLRASIKAQPDDIQRTLALLNFLSTRRSVEVAETAYLAAIADRPKDAELRFGLANLYRRADRAADARRVLQEVIDTVKGEAGLTARNQLALYAWLSGKTVKARALAEEVLVASPRDGAALMLRGRMRLEEGNPKSAISDLRAAAKDQPYLPELVGLMAQAHRRAGEPQLAREALADAVKYKPDDPDLRLLLAADMADAKQYKEAGAEVDAVLAAAPRYLRAYDFKVLLAQLQKDTTAAEKTYQALKAQIPDDPIGPMKLGQFYAAQNKTDAALAEYDAAARLAPTASAPVLAATGLLIGLHRYDEAAARIDAIEQRDPKSLLAKQLRGQLAMARGDTALATQAFMQIINQAPTLSEGYQGLARVKAEEGKIAEVISVLEQGEKANPTDLSLPSSRAEWLVRAGRQREAIKVYEALLRRSGDEDGYANNLAYLLAETSTDKASLERALSLLQRFNDSSNPSYLDSLGWTQYKLGRYDEAVAALERASGLAPEEPLLQLHLGLALYKKGDITRAQELLKMALASKSAMPELDEARQILAQR